MTMATSLQFFAASLLLLMHNTIVSHAATCGSNDCFISSRAAHYPNSEELGTACACGYGSFGATLNGGEVAAVSDLYRNGIGCGACYQVKCTNSNYCTDKGTTVVVTDQGTSHNTGFILSRRAISGMAQTKDSAASLLALGIIDIKYTRVSCSYPNKNITIKIDENSSYPHYLAFVIWYQQGQRDVTAVQLCETENFTCKVLERSYGSVWTITSPPTGLLSLRMLFTDENSGEETWVVPATTIPSNWKAGDLYDTGSQVNL
ncbi:Expansin-like B1 [Linum grandiflorum]